MNWLSVIKASLYITNITWSVQLIWSSYQQTAEIFTALFTVIILLSTMIFNDLIKNN